MSSDNWLKEGWLAFLPYLCLYLVFLYFHLPAARLEILFHCLHAVFLCVAVYVLHQSWMNGSRSERCFWVCLFFLFLLPGAYLEFPSDPWEHLRRILSWQNSSYIDDNPIRGKFAYYWSWTLLGWLPFAYRRSGLDLYSAFWQLALSCGFYFLATTLGFSRRVAKLQVLGSTLLFGTNLFGLRYYALSSTPLAYLSLLRIEMDLVELARRMTSEFVSIQRSGAHMRQLGWRLPLLILMIYFNHAQELLFLLISFMSVATYILGFWLWRTRGKLRSKLAISGLVTLLFSSALAAALEPREFTTLFRFANLAPILGTRAIPWTEFHDQLSRLSTFRVWKPYFQFAETLGVSGGLSIIFSVVFLARYPLLSVLSLVPFCLLLFPPVVLLIAMLTPIPNTYRLLYAFPLSFSLVAGLVATAQSALSKLRLSDTTARASVVAAVLLLAIAAPPWRPWRGRGWFQVYRPPRMLTLADRDPLTQWLSKNRRYLPNCIILSDDVDTFMVTAQLGLKNYFGRLSVESPLASPSRTKEVLASGNQICAILIPDAQLASHVPDSTVAKLSGHWRPDLTRSGSIVPLESREAVERLIEKGWRKILLPAGYWLYEPVSLAAH